MLGLEELEEFEPAYVLRLAFWSITFAGYEVGGCWTITGTLEKLCRGDAGRRLREPEREKEALAAARGCWRGVMSSSLSSWMLSIAPPVVALLSYQLGDLAEGMLTSSCAGLKGERTLAGERGTGEGDRELPGVELSDCWSKPGVVEVAVGRECALVMGGAASEEPPDRERTCGRAKGERLRWLDVGLAAGGLEK